MQDGATIEPGASLLAEERGGVVDRRRVVPSPPCLPPDAAPPLGAIPLAELSDDVQRELLPSIAAAIDRVHRYRIAHGALGRQTIFVDANTIWISGVDAVWQENSNQGSPREQDLVWFRNECEGWLGPSVQPGVGRTCCGMLAAWHESPPIPATLSQNGRRSPPRTIVRRKRLRQRIPWRSISVVFLIVSVVASVGAWQLTPLPMYTFRTLRWGFRRLPASARAWIDPDGKFDPVGLRLRTAGDLDQWTRLELGLSMQRREALIQVLTEPGDEYTELFRRFVSANDSGFLVSVASMYSYIADWAPKSVPRLKVLLREQLPLPAVRTLEHCFLRAAGVDELPTIERLVKSPGHPDSVADAYDALARLDRPAPVEKLIIGLRDAGPGSRIQYLTTVLYHYSEPDAYRFLNTYSNLLPRGALADAWHDILGVVESAPNRFRSRASKTFERVLVEAIPKTLSIDGPSADADLLTTLLCLWRLQTVSPEDLVERLSEPTPQGEKIRKRLSTMLVGSASEPPETVELPEGWDIPDEWFAAVLAGAAEYPAPFVRKVVVDHARIRPLQQQSRLLALANIRPEPAREALAENLSRYLVLYRDSWRTRQPLMISSICSLLASARNHVADEALTQFLAPGPYGRELPAWEGLLVGALVDPARHRTSLKSAATHPLPSIHIRARELLALADGNVAAFRNPDRTKPELPETLESLVEQLETAANEADVSVVFSRQRTAYLSELALGLSSSPGAVAVLHARVDRNEAPHSTYLLLANQPTPLDRRRFDDFLRAENYQPMDPAVMIAQVLRDDRRSLSTIRSVAVGPRTGRNAPPLLHRVVAMQAYGALLTAAAPPETVREILEVIDRDPSLYVRHAAAAAALHCVKPEDKALLVEFAANRPKLPPGVADILKLTGKL